MIPTRERYRGCLLGLAIGDALGTTLEFNSPGAFSPIGDMIGGGPFHLQPGEWTDDTSMALCLAESLIQCRGFAPEDQMNRYVRWWRHGHLSSTGRCFDIGNTTRTALSRFEQTKDPFSGTTDPRAAGNGSLMRLAPVPMFLANEPSKAIEMAGEMSRTTHGAVTAIDACRYMTALIVGALKGASKDELLADHYSPIPGCWKEHALTPNVDAIAAGSFKHKEPPEIRGTGYVVESLEAALWAFHKSASFKDGCLLAVNLGDDADTTGAIYGQLVGAYYGEAGIPEAWRKRVTMLDEITSFADGLFELSQTSNVRKADNDGR